MNRIVLLGRLGADVETRSLPDGTPAINIRMATSEKSKDGEWISEWHSVTAIGKWLHDIMIDLRKGREVFVEGKVQTRSWEKDGKTNYKTEVKASTIRVMALRPKQHEAVPSFAQAPVAGERQVFGELTDEDIPF